AHGKLDQFMIQKRHTAFDGCSHAHVVLFHQQLDEVSLDVGVKQPLQHSACSLFPVLKDLLVGCARLELTCNIFTKEIALLKFAECGEEIVEVERCPRVAVFSQACVRQFSLCIGADQS